MGATATGKSDLAIALALDFGGEVVSMDSRQVYRGLDVGTGKVDAAARARVPHHLLDILDADETGSAGRHAERAERAMREIAARGRVPFLAGGTGLYFRALFTGLVPVRIPRDELARIRASFTGRPTQELYHDLAGRDPARAGALSANDRVRVTRALEIIAYTGTPVTELYGQARTPPSDIAYLKLVLTLPRALLRERVARRTRALFERGWIDEVRSLLAAGVDPRSPAMNSVGYAEIVTAIRNGVDPLACVDRVITLTQQYAKRQETFFRSEPGALRFDVSQGGAADEMRARVSAFLRGDALNNNLTHSS
jgi:tRNA dimethylallyltransferase